MSTDLFSITVLSKKRDQLVLRVVTGFAGGRNDYACTRSFALSLLARARSRFNENASRPRELSKGVRFRKAPKATALERESEKWPGGWYTSEEFFQENVGKYIVKTHIRERRNKGRSDSFSDTDHERLQAVEDQNLPLTEFEEALCEHFHFIELEVHATDARWFDGIEAGWSFGTTSYDVWWNDPARPRAPASTQVAKKPGAKDGAPQRAKKVALKTGVRVQLHPSVLDGVRAVLMERRKATIPGTLASLYKNHEYALLTTDDGLVVWANVPTFKAIRGVDAYEEGRTDPEAFWVRVTKLPLIARARAVAQAIGGGGLGDATHAKAPRYPVRSRRVAGFLSSMSIERAAQVISAAFPRAPRPARFAEYHLYEKSPRDFDPSEWRPFQRETRIKFHPDYVISGLVGGLAWRVAHESAASGKAPARLVSKEALEALKQVPEAEGWLKFFRHSKPARAEPFHVSQEKFGLPGNVL